MDCDCIVLSLGEAEEFVRILENPEPPSPALIEAYNRGLNCLGSTT